MLGVMEAAGGLAGSLSVAAYGAFLFDVGDIVLSCLFGAMQMGNGWEEASS
jgi:hypothetical protein